MPETSPPPTRRFAPIPVETSVKKARRFAVESVETTARSSKKEDAQKTQDVDVERKDFAPKRRFLPEPVETSVKSSKAAKPLPTPEPTPVSIPQSPPVEETPKPRRKFVPELIETSKRSKKAGDSRPATLPTDKTDLTPGVPNIYTRPKRKHKAPPPSSDLSDSHPKKSTRIPPLPPRRQPSMKPHLNTRRNTRQNSFQPELEVIASSESDSQGSSDEEDGSDGDVPSLSQSLGESEDSLMRLQLARTRESCDDRFSGYLLALAAKAAEKQLREQALAAFPNQSEHEIVEHFYDREVEGASDAESVEGIGLLFEEDSLPINLRRKSTEVGWAVKEMQQHQEKLNRQREEETNKKIAAEASKPSFKDPFWSNGMTSKNAAFARAQDKESFDPQKEAELDRMRLAASPPMLGTDLVFRMCPSPKATKFESDQRIETQQPNRCDKGGGLWGGYCVADEVGEYLSPSLRGPPLIMTPRSESKEDPFSSAFGSELPGGAKSPRTTGGDRDGVRMLSGIDERLKAEVARSKAESLLSEEFNDTFVTQVYNYLSLGYPSLAWQYDAELARISRIPVEELRSDDSSKNAKGHIGLTEAAEGVFVKDGKREYGARWKALRIYIMEWGTQNPSMSNGAAPIAWGVRARRGSWAI